MKIKKLILLILIQLFFNQVYTKTPNPYKILGVNNQATEQDIRRAFKKRSLKYHPDRNKSDPKAKQKFQKIVNAYELLKDPERKRIYDLTGEDNPQQQQQGGGFGFPGGFGFGGINIQQLLRQQMGGMGGQRPGGQGQGQGQRRTTYSFSFGGGQGMRFQF